jgi:phosphotransferase system  glucose/maltose/N-acetylglucosamine-specific IIC component
VKYFIAKIFEVYSNNEDFNAVFRTRIYLIAVLTSAFSAVGLVLYETIYNFLTHKKPPLSPFIVIIYLLIVIYFSNKILTAWLTKEKLNDLKSKYNQPRFPPFIVYTLMILLFLILLFSGPFISTLINGGEILGERINGILH